MRARSGGRARLGAGHGAPPAAPAAGERAGESGPGGACLPGGPRGAVGSGGAARAVGGPSDAVRPRHPRPRPVPSPRRAPARRGSPGPAAGGTDSLANGGTARVRRPHRPLRVSPTDGLAEQVRTTSCDHGIKPWREHLTPEQMESAAYALWLHGMTGSAAEANRFAREYGVARAPSPAEQDGSAPGAVVTTAPGKAAPRGAGSNGRGGRGWAGRGSG
ncbi:DUF6417 family protein [Streptomyces sp. NPDC058086]|uniref:DUF6417 family protein n=1 Tax=Streptomyces sp. NPDC058086 TaxID=3346334 RepID=UPI0036E7E0B6